MTEDMKDLLQRFEPKEFAVATADPQVLAARFSPSGDWLVAGGYDGRVRLWDVRTDEPRELPALTGHHGWVQTLAFSSDSQRLVTADSWGQLSLWNLSGEQPQLAWSQATAHDGWLREVDISADGQHVVSCGRDAMIRLWSAVDGTRLQELTGHTADVYCVRFHPQQPLLVSADERGWVKVWDLATGQFQRQFDASLLYLEHRLQDVGGVRSLALDSTGETLAVGGTIPKNGGTVQGTPCILVFDFASGELRHTLKLGDPNHCFVHDLGWHVAGFLMAVTSGTPGQGQLLFQRPADETPFFLTTKLPNCHSLSLHEPTRRLAVVTTNRGSNGNGRQLDKSGAYAGNHSPIHLFRLP